MNSKPRSIIVVDDDHRVLDQISSIMDSTHVVLTTSDPNRAHAWLKNDVSVSAIIVGQKLRNSSGPELLMTAQRLRPEARRVLIADYTDLSVIVASMHTGAVQRTVSKPISATELIPVLGSPVTPSRPSSSRTAVQSDASL
jgi:DNA-binding NtrC family response regulator